MKSPEKAGGKENENDSKFDSCIGIAGRVGVLDRIWMDPNVGRLSHVWRPTGEP